MSGGGLMPRPERLRVLHAVAAAVASADGHRGVNGPELRTLNMLPLLRQQGIDSVIAYPPHGALWSRFRRSGAPVIPFVQRGRFDRHGVRLLAALCREHGAEVLTSQGPASLDLMCTAAARRAGVALVVTRPSMIDDLPLPRWRRWLYARIDQRTLAGADRLIAVSADGFDRLQARVGDERLKLIRNGVDLDRFVPRARAGGGELVVGACAQLTQGKGWDLFLRVLAHGTAAGLPLRGLVVGDGPLRQQLERTAADHGLGARVEFCGRQDDVVAALARMDVFLFLSRREGLPVAVLEAMAMGLPCIATDVGGTRELVRDGVTGFLVPAEDWQAAAQQLAALAEDAALRQRLGRAARDLCEREHDLRRMAANYSTTYREAVRRREVRA